MKKRLIAISCLVAACYVLGYGIVRERKCLVMTEYLLKEERLRVREVDRGFDIRTNARGQLKNQMNGYVEVVYLPLSIVETLVRGGTESIDLDSE